MEDKKYYLGLDIGTDSVGWAVTDDSYHLVKKQGKHLWGSRLFDEAQTAKERRMHRSARRRYHRRRERILILRSLFKSEMDKVDPDFFDRLDSSFLHKEDKKEGIHLPCIISGDKSFANKYKTIYHLREALLTSEEKFDIRYVYLALAHMIKYRGNFLREGELKSTAISAQELKDLFAELDKHLAECQADDEDDEEFDAPAFNLSLDQAQTFIDLFMKDTKRGDRQDREIEALGDKPKGVMKAILRLLNGYDTKLGDWFPRLKEQDPEMAKKKVETDSDKFDEILENPALCDEEKDLLRTCKTIADDFILLNLLKGESSITKAMIGIYDEYHRDLADLKYVVTELETKGILPKGFKKEFFDSPSGSDGKVKANYAGFTGQFKIRNASGNKAKGKVTKCKEEDFLSSVQKEILDKAKGNLDILSDKCKEKFNRLVKRVDMGKLFQRQNNKANGVLPYQLNEIELKKILQNQGKYYPFLLDKDKSFPNPDKQDYKIVSLLRYRIPYYIGPISNPVNGKQQKNHWVVKKDENIKIYPWNFFDVIDRVKSAEKFMKNLRNTCTYIKGEQTLPKNSLTFQKFKVLNELNNLLYGGAEIDYEAKKYLFDNLYLTKKTIKRIDIKNALKAYTGKSAPLTNRNKGSEDDDESNSPSLSSLSSFIDFETIFGKGFYKDRALYEKSEKCIYTISSFENKQTRIEQLRGFLNEAEAAKVANLNYKDFATLSKKLIDGITSEVAIRETGEVIQATILDLMLRTGDNFMSIYEGGKYSFKQQVDAMNEAYAAKFPGKKQVRRQLIEESYLNPAMKRAVYQTLKIIDELRNILRIESFDKIFVECARSKSKDKKKTESRKKKIEDYIKSAKDLRDEANSLLEELGNKTDDQLRSKHLFLYFMQLGHDVYTGEPIDINRLSQDYDVDHIIPQAVLKDDSFLNTVLTSRSKNNAKQDTYPLSDGFITESGKHWIDVLTNCGLMPKEKKFRLERVQPLNDDELAGFINRQLVTTNQSVKAVCDILKLTEATKTTNIIYSKAGLVSDFRGFFHLPKVRDLNDFHHANDAYLNIVVGDVYNQKFSNRMTANLIEKLKQQDSKYSWKSGAEDVFSKKVFARGNSQKLIWIPSQYKDGNRKEEVPTAGATINLVRKTLSWNDPLVTWMTHDQSGKQGFFNKIAYVKAGEVKDTNYPLKKVPGDTTQLDWMKKYGAYSDMTTSYFCLIKSDKGYSLEGVLSLVDGFISNSTSKLERSENLKRYFEAKGLRNVEIIIDRVPICTIIKIKGDDNSYCRLAIAGRSNDSLIAYNASEPSITAKWQAYLKNISKITGSSLPAGQKKDLSTYRSRDSFENSIQEGESSISKAENQAFYEYLTQNVFKRNEFRSLPIISKTLNSLYLYKSDFEKLCVIDQAQMLLNLVRLISCKSGLVSLKEINETLPKCVGKIMFSKLLKPNARIIQTSPTGFREKILFEVPSK